MIALCRHCQTKRPVQSQLGFCSPQCRFMAKVAEADSGCWIWKGARNNYKGYGRIDVNGRRYLAHRYGFQLFRGYLSDDKSLDHLCRNTRCVNPAHMEPVSVSENSRRMSGSHSTIALERLALPTNNEMPVSFFDEYRSKFDIDESTGCWLWKTLSRGGYGAAWARKPITAHRLAWTLTRGAIPEGLQVLHRCDVRRCVNPDHLFIGTHAENMVDRNNKGRQAFQRGEDHPSAKLSASDVIEIRSASEPLRVLAERYGVKKSTIANLRSNRGWSVLLERPE